MFGNRFQPATFDRSPFKNLLFIGGRCFSVIFVCLLFRTVYDNIWLPTLTVCALWWMVVVLAIPPHLTTFKLLVSHNFSYKIHPTIMSKWLTYVLVSTNWFILKHPAENKHPGQEGVLVNQKTGSDN